MKAVGICGWNISPYKKLGPYEEGMTFGHEFAGEVTEVGSGVSWVRVGDRVAGCPAFHCGERTPRQKGELSRCETTYGYWSKTAWSFRSKVKLLADHVLLLPDRFDYTTAALVEPSSLVAYGFYRTSIQPGAEVAIVGCGSIGLLAVQWARIFGSKASVCHRYRFF